MNDETKCPCCPNHCDINNLSCGRGIAHFNKNEKNIESLSLNDQIINDLRKCGHLLHHNKDINPSKILSVFSEEELQELHELLSKFYNNVE